jgi:hypothetical protein
MDSNKIKRRLMRQVALQHNHENIKGARYCVKCGDPLMEQKMVEDCLCSACRHVVGSGDTYCWYCGATLKESELIEHYISGKLDADSFNKVKLSVEGKKQ